MKVSLMSDEVSCGRRRQGKEGEGGGISAGWWGVFCCQHFATKEWSAGDHPAGLWGGVWVCECTWGFSVGVSEITAVQGIMFYPPRHTYTSAHTCFCLLFNRLGPILDIILPKQFCSFFAVRSKKVDSTICEAISLNLLNSSFKLPGNNTKSYEIKSKSHFFLSQFFP